MTTKTIDGRYEPITISDTPPAKSAVRENAERDSSYRPYCLRCPTLVRMEIVMRFLWKCSVCGATHDERD
jgi:ribosomal protein L37AE/L43A